MASSIYLIIDRRSAQIPLALKEEAFCPIPSTLSVHNLHLVQRQTIHQRLRRIAKPLRRASAIVVFQRLARHRLTQLAQLQHGVGKFGMALAGIEFGISDAIRILDLSRMFWCARRGDIPAFVSASHLAHKRFEALRDGHLRGAFIQPQSNTVRS